MKIVVTGDTHISNHKRQLPARLLTECHTADLVIHTGDWTSMEVYRTLSRYAKVIGVYGNVDGEEIKENFQAKEIVEAKGYKIGIVHGHGKKKTTEKRALEAFEEDGVDIVIFGHSHIPMIRYFDQVMLMNPGSPTAKRRLPYFSYGVLKLDESFQAEINYF